MVCRLVASGLVAASLLVGGVALSGGSPRWAEDDVRLCIVRGDGTRDWAPLWSMDRVGAGDVRCSEVAR